MIFTMKLLYFSLYFEIKKNCVGLFNLFFVYEYTNKLYLIIVSKFPWQTENKILS